jgi:hypothetical protein
MGSPLPATLTYFFAANKKEITMEPKICPFMNGNPGAPFTNYCEKEKCMAWGEIDKPPKAFEGCLLIHGSGGDK